MNIMLFCYPVLQHEKFLLAFRRCFKELLPETRITECIIPPYSDIALVDQKLHRYLNEFINSLNIDEYDHAFFIDSFYPPNVIKLLKEKGIKTVLLVHGSLHWREQIPLFDYSFLHGKLMYEQFYKDARFKNNNNVYFLPLFLDEKQDYPCEETSGKEFRAVFIGSLTGKRIDIWKKGKNTFRENDIYFPRQEYSDSGKGEKFLTQEDVRCLYSRSACGISLIREQTELPLKTFEIPAYDIPMVTDALPHLLDGLFNIDEELTTFTDLGDMVDKIIEITDNKKHCEFLARNSKDRVFKEHLAIHRCMKILDTLEMEYKNGKVDI